MKDWALAYPWLTFFLAWGVCMGSLYTIRRFARLLTIALRGWPPPHLDADGDFREKE